MSAAPLSTLKHTTVTVGPSQRSWISITYSASPRQTRLTTSVSRKRSVRAARVTGTR